MVSKLVELYRTLPTFRPEEDLIDWIAAVQETAPQFRTQVRSLYTEGTLQRLLQSPDRESRRAAVFALGQVGTWASNAAVATALHDEDAQIRRLAEMALWEIWFRGGTEEQNAQLQRLAHLDDFLQVLAGLDDLIREAPEFAEAYNQRAILYYRRGEFVRSIRDCDTVIRLNPYHFGAMAGRGQCYLKLGRPRLALPSFEQALRVNPNLVHLQTVIDHLREIIDNTEDEASGTS